MTVTSTPVWHDIFRRVTLKPDNITLEAERFDDTLNIVRGPGVNFGTTNIGTDTFEINVDYNISVPAATTKLSLEDVNGNLSEITFTPGRGVAINRISAQELEFESFSVTETDTLHTVTGRNNITSNKIFVDNIEVGTIASNSSEDGFTGYDAGHNLIGDGTLSNPMRFSPLYQDSLAANNTDQFEFIATGPGTLAYAANYVFDTAATTGSVTLEREDPANPGNWVTLDTQSGNTVGIAYSIDGTYSELYSGSVTYRLTFAWTGNTGTSTWFTNNTFEGGAYTPIINPQLKTDTVAKTVDINDIQFFQNTIRTTSSNTDVVFDLSGTGQVRVLGNATANMFYGNLTGNVTGDVSGNAGTVTNGVYTTGSYADPIWITSLNASKIVGEIDLSNILVDGTIRIFDNVIETVVSNADLELRPSGTGQVVIVGDLTAIMLYGNVTGNVNGNLTGNVTGNVNGNLIGNVTSNSINASEITVDNTIRIFDNVIETVLSNSNLELRANGTGQVVITDTLTASEIVGPIGTSVQNSGAFTTLSASQTVTLNTANSNISLQPTGTGTITINPATAGTINNMSIGATTRAAGNFTSLDANGNVILGGADVDTITVNGSFVTGTVLRSAKSNGNTLNIAAYDIDGAVYTNLITLTASNTPSLTLVSTGVGTINNMSIGATTASTGRFTTLEIRDTATTAFDLFFESTSSVPLTADRTLTLDVLNANRTVKLAGNIDIAGNLTTANSFTTSGNFTLTLTTTAATNVTLPTSGTLYGTATGSITSNQLLTSMSDETGTGFLVFSTNPTLTSPAYGTASSTADLDATVDAATTSFYAYIQSASGTARTINVSNLTSGRTITLYLRNTNVGTKVVNIASSTTTTGFAAVNLSRGAGQTSATSVTLAASTGTATITVFNIGGTFGGSIG